MTSFCSPLFLALAERVSVKVVLYKRCNLCPVLYSTTNEASQSLGWNIWLPEALQAGVLKLIEEWWPGQNLWITISWGRERTGKAFNRSLSRPNLYHYKKKSQTHFPLLPDRWPLKNRQYFSGQAKHDLLVFFEIVWIIAKHWKQLLYSRNFSSGI